MMRSRFLWILLGLTLVLGACKKAKIDPSDKLALLARTWQASDVLNDGKSQISLYADLQMTFQRDTTYTYFYTTSYRSGKGSWHFNSDSTQLIYDRKTSNETTFNITELNQKSLKLEEYSGGHKIDFFYYPK